LQLSVLWQVVGMLIFSFTTNRLLIAYAQLIHKMSRLGPVSATLANASINCWIV